MKKRIILLTTTLILSFFVVNSVVAQDKPQEPKKAKTEMVKKDVSSKCGSCPSLAKCNKDGAVKARAESGEVAATKEKDVATKKKKRVRKK